MASIDDLETLTESIGQFTLSSLGKENLRRLSVVVNPVDQTCEVSITLVDDSGESQLEIIRSMLEVEQVFLDDVVMSFSFVDIDDASVAHGLQRQFSYA
ncbi:hypothetical protein [Rathayibacter sp. VKM Ac-2857]|uniref:hypothetical protein n=1 Tax=Rathayibacter sp. VKM Ac-2857 TaxID=2739020 RepID=UPI0015659CAE|nr:hypothetical protein [Rathayibacter sp. VKM Ac-2857]NQX15122.1 hypothetical protein [Rathayibacter sp. VKM Ac-2857]